MSIHKNTLNKAEDHNILIGYNKLFCWPDTFSEYKFKKVWDDPRCARISSVSMPVGKSSIIWYNGKSTQIFCIIIKRSL